jgi:hypothetical protein
MTDALSRLKAALSDRYTIERELGVGGMAIRTTDSLDHLKAALARAIQRWDTHPVDASLAH